MIVNGNSDVVYPYGFGDYAMLAFVDDNDVSEFLTNGFNISTLHNKSKKFMSRFGFCQFFDREVYIAGGGENEKFIAYAPEDEERAYRFMTLGYNVDRVNEYAYHLEHVRTPNSWRNNPHMKSNLLLWEKIRRMDKNQLISYYNL